MKLLIAISLLTIYFAYSQSTIKRQKSIFDKQINIKDFTKYFPETNFAKIVAEKLNKELSDNVTEIELAKIKGYFEVGPSGVGN